MTTCSKKLIRNITGTFEIYIKHHSLQLITNHTQLPSCRRSGVDGSSLSKKFSSCSITLCHADFHEFLESQPNLLKAIRSCDNNTFGLSNLLSQHQMGKFFMTARSGADSGNEDEEEEDGSLGLEPQRGSRTDVRDEAPNS